MGMSPAEVDTLSIWQFAAACDGYAKANDPEAGKKLTAAEADDLWEFVKG